MLPAGKFAAGVGMATLRHRLADPAGAPRGRIGEIRGDAA
jgi:hypothetical protein